MINNESFKKLLLLFIIIQPVLDILTFFSIKQLNMSITIGIVVRVLFMGVSLLFIFFGNNSSFKKYVIPYLLALFAVVGIGLVYNFFDKPIFNVFLELQYVAKTLYFIIMFCSYLLLFTNNDKMNETKLQILKSITIAMMIVAATMFISIVTGTASETYDYNKFGFKGWFFSGNEISSIVAISFPMVYLYALKKMQSFKQAYFLIPAFLLAASSVIIGTKVGYFAVLGTTIMILASYLIWWIAGKVKRSAISGVQKKLIATLLFFGLFLLLTPISPAVSNVTNDAGLISQETQQEEQNPEEEETPTPEEEAEEVPEEELETNASFIESPILRIILSSRNLYFSDMLNQYIEADPIQKIFGMGYAGNYTERDKTIEMDFFDLFFSFGIIGIILLIVPFISIAYFLIKRLFTMPKRVFTPENILFFASVGMGTGIAFLAGHVLFAPAVAIYLAISLVLLLVNMIHAGQNELES
ncbi:O-antigen ligase domain-containing protein [Halobacillus fulvus]|nr:O-antigen ligase domain-containing protein [Halobacillus fulvus]